MTVRHLKYRPVVSFATCIALDIGHNFEHMKPKRCFDFVKLDIWCSFLFGQKILSNVKIIVSTSTC